MLVCAADEADGRGVSDLLDGGGGGRVGLGWCVICWNRAASYEKRSLSVSQLQAQGVCKKT